MNKFSLIILTAFIAVTTLCAFDLKVNTCSNIIYVNSNYGLNGYDVKQRISGITWPRNSPDYYQFSAGLLIGAKTSQNDNTDSKSKTIGISTKTAQISFVPGSNEIDKNVSIADNVKEKYPLYISSDYNNKGIAKDPNAPNWPLWNTDNTTFGKYVTDDTKRNKQYYAQGPRFLGDETMVSIYKDTDIKYHIKEQQNDIPYLNLQVEEKTIFWDSDPLNDVVLVIYTITNMSDKTWEDASFAKLFDFDIKKFNNEPQDRVKKHSSKDIYYCWTDNPAGPDGYMAISLMISPELDANKYPIANNNYKNYYNGIKIATAINFDKSNQIDNYISYEEMTSKKSITPAEGDDQRLLLASETFNLAPGQSVTFGVAQIFGNATLNGSTVKASGDESELAEINDKWKALYEEIYTDGLPIQSTTVEETNNEQENFCYPNPTNGTFNLSAELNEESVVEVYDIYGNKLLTHKGTNSNFDLSNFESGTYFISVRNNNRTVYDKIVLQK